MGRGYETDKAFYGDLPSAPAPVADTELRRAAIRIADQLGREFPHQLDTADPQAAGQATGRELAVKVGLLELCDALGIRTDDIRRRP